MSLSWPFYLVKLHRRHSTLFLIIYVFLYDESSTTHVCIWLKSAVRQCNYYYCTILHVSACANVQYNAHVVLRGASRCHLLDQIARLTARSLFSRPICRGKWRVIFELTRVLYRLLSCSTFVKIEFVLFCDECLIWPNVIALDERFVFRSFAIYWKLCDNILYLLATSSVSRRIRIK